MADQDSAPPIFIVDTSSWLEIERHPAENRILSALVPMIEAGRIKFLPEVFKEIKETSRLFVWLSHYKDVLVENRRAHVDYLTIAGTIAYKFPAMCGTMGKKDKADPWVIAMAIHAGRNPRARVIVCNETVRRRPNRKIPTVCQAYGIECKTMLEMLHMEYPEDGWNL
jgi:hypothetical protein